MDDTVDLSQTRKVRESGSSVAVTIPPAVVEKSGIEPGEQVLFTCEEDGGVTMIPWSEDDIRDAME
ncbi:hypothetical protein HOV17_gp02 [Halorubrum pleomorphic virus 9]|uniref:SpoVT-AbrB domain-containing protein n=1 Tax=Halorubrum pleomorphic virus 9 TaxID=2126525 RepID=A0A3S7I7I0_9VIRU|nr:hypothetical protein HOV17_gp02 [Halorubrum pleomorphic virus 9]AVP39965.1 hypothetical protein [Halorubrum pleomorphic virus 9]